MKASAFHLSTTRETPADAEIVSHQLMIRAGMIRKLTAGIYTWSPLGLRVLRKVENIVREEMDRAGYLEMLMPAVQPAELWQRRGVHDLVVAVLEVFDRGAELQGRGDHVHGVLHAGLGVEVLLEVCLGLVLKVRQLQAAQDGLVQGQGTDQRACACKSSSRQTSKARS